MQPCVLHLNIAAHERSGRRHGFGGRAMSSLPVPCMHVNRMACVCISSTYSHSRHCNAKLGA